MRRGIVPGNAAHRHVTTLAALILVSRPGQANLYFGQVALLVTLASMGALHYARSRPWLAGVALAIATLKPTFGGPVAVLMLARHDFRAAAIGLAIGAAIALTGAGLIAARDPHHTDFWALAFDNQAALNKGEGVDPAQSVGRVDLPMVAERLLGPGGRTWWRMALPLTLILAAGVTLLQLDRRRAGVQGGTAAGDWEIDRLSDSIVLVTTCLCIYHYIYDGLLLVLPAVWMYQVACDHKHPIFVRRLAMLVLAAFSIPALNYFTSKQVGQLLHQYWDWSSVLSPASPARLWTLACIASGVALAIAWCLLLIMVRSIAFAPADKAEAATGEPAAMPSVSGQSGAS